jgi:hypothetical protein
MLMRMYQRVVLMQLLRQALELLEYLLVWLYRYWYLFSSGTFITRRFEKEIASAF